MNIPTQIGRYHVVGHLASGGMAEIFLGKLLGPSGFERPVVIKRVLPGLSQNQGFLEMFLDEARVVSRISHPNVVTVHELGRDDDGLFMVMEYLQGETVLSLLRRLVRTGHTIDLALAAHIVEQTCAGLHAAHELKGEDGSPLRLVHRDVSPSNVMISYDGAVKVLDFGIAKFSERMTDTEAGMLKGKFAYMSPEQCTAERTLDRRSDIFSLGILLFEISTGKRLFARPTSLLTMKAITEEAAASPTRLDPNYPDSLAAICRKALSRDRADRYATAAEMRADLLRAGRQLGPDMVPEMALAELMRTTFADRIGAKGEMLARVRAGDDITELPELEVDVSVELPTAFSAADGTPFEWDVGVRSRAAWLGAVMLLAITLAVGVGFLLGGDDRASGSAIARADRGATVDGDGPASDEGGPAAGSDDSAAEHDPETHDALAGSEGAPSTGAAAALDPAGATTPAGTPVALEVASTPPGATVLVDGEDRGETPLRLELPRAEAPLIVRVQRRGFEVHEASFVPSEDGEIHARLDRIRRRTNPAPSTDVPSPPGGDPFRRFN